MQTIIMYVLKIKSTRRVNVTMDNMNTVFESGEIEILKDNYDSEIRKFYAGKNILLTGCTGFLGTFILEKLLRVCTEMSKLYIIVRPRKGLPTGERIKLYFENVVFNGLRKINPNFMEKVVLIQVTPSYEGPTQGWIKNLNALTGPNMSISLGLLHVIPATRNVITDNIPGDMTVNYLLALIWDHVTHRKSCKLEVYNYGSSDWNPITYGRGRKLLINTSRKYPLRKMVWYPTVTFINNIHIFFVIHMLLTMTPAAVYDLIRIIRMKKAMAVNMVRTKTRQLELYYPFIACTWIVKTNKAKNLLSRMNAADLEEFKFDLSLLDWKVAFVGYLHSFRMFWKETPNDLIIARKKYRVLQILHYTLWSLFVLFLSFLCYIIVCSLFYY